MKKSILLICLIMLLIYDSTAQSLKIDLDNISSTDSTCLKEIKAAKKDIQNGKLVYCRYSGHMLYIHLRSVQEFKTLLSQFGIGYKESLFSDMIRHGQTQGCYRAYMNNAIDKKFGSTFIDSLLNVSDSLFLRNHIDGILRYNDCDTQPIYPGDSITKHESEESALQKSLGSIRYPEGYAQKKNWEYKAYVDVDMLVDKQGNASIPEYWFHFDIPENYKYENNLISEIKRVIKKTNWTPATIKKQKVKTLTYYRLYLK